jgi:hypothetical protein
MKKLTTFFAVAVFAVLSACGPSKEEKEAADKRIQDSIAIAETMMAEQEAAKAAEMLAADTTATDSSAVQAPAAEAAPAH